MYYFPFKWAVYFRSPYQILYAPVLFSRSCHMPRPSYLPLFYHPNYIWCAVDIVQQLVMQSSPAWCFFLSTISLCSPLMRKTECHTQATQQAKLHLITYHIIPSKPISLSLQTLYLVMQSKHKVRQSNTTMFANECRFIQLHLSIRTESSGIHSYVLTCRDWIAHID